MFKSDTPSDINSYSLNDVLSLLEDVPGSMTASKRVRLNYVKMLYDVLGFSLSPDVALAFVSEAPALLVLSTAGGGKTTWSQIKAIAQKLLRRSKSDPNHKVTGDKILCLVYNTHNVKDMTEKHAQMVNRLMAAGIDGLSIDSRINASTMHSFCEFIRKQFIAKLGYVGCQLADDTESTGFMERAVKVVLKQNGVLREDVNATKLHALYVMCKETLKGISELHQTDLYTDLELEDSFITSVFERYDIIKGKSRRYEFVDMLYNVMELLKNDEKALSFVQGYYDYVIADEVQDFTPLMWELLRLFVSDGTPLTCIGDEDQNLYSFRGANLYDTLEFTKRFPGGKVYTLSENRRCPDVILSEAKRVISENVLRFNKTIVGKKLGGSIKTVPYNTTDGQIIQLVRELKKLTPDERNRTVVCYRNLEASRLLSEVLAEEGIDFRCIKAFMPYSFELYNHVTGILNALEMPCDRDCFKVLWKVLPCKKSEFMQELGFNPSMGKFTTPDHKTHFGSYNYGRLMGYNGFAEAMEVLIRVSSVIETTPMSKIFPLIYEMLKKYFWNYKRRTIEDDEICNIFEKRVEEKFSVDRTYSQVYRDMQSAIGVAKSNSAIGVGIALSTFHSLKGLEFSKVFAIFMDNDIFPNYPLIEYKRYDYPVEQALKEAETRLWYVAITRSLDSLTIFYNRENPSKYVVDYFASVNGNRDDAVRATAPLVTATVLEGECIGDFVEDFVDDDCEECIEDFVDVSMEPVVPLELPEDNSKLEKLNSFNSVADSGKSNFLYNLLGSI